MTGPRLPIGMDTMQDYNTTIEPVAPSNGPFAVMHGNERPVWDLEHSDSASDSSEYSSDGYTSADSILRESRMPSARRKPTIQGARKRTHNARQQYGPRNSKKPHHRQLDETQNKAPSTPPITPIFPPLKSVLAVHDTDVPALDHVWKLLDTWYMHRGRGENPPCAVEQSRLDHLHFIGTRENSCTYFDRQGKVLRVTSLPLKGWEDRGLHIIIAFSSDRDPVIIRGRGSRLNEKSKDEGTTRFPFYIWQGISGDAEGWESEPSIAKVVRYSNPSFYNPINLKRRRLENPKPDRPLDLKSRVSPPKSLKRSPLLSESFPELLAQLNGWMKNDPSGKDPAFVLNNQPNLYLSLRHPELRVSYVDLDGEPVNVGLYFTGVGKKHVVVADGPSLGPAIISFDQFRKLPKYYTSYYRWTSTRTWMEPPCVFKVFGDGPYEPPRKFVESILGVGWLAREVALAQSVPSSKVSDCKRTVIDLLDEPGLPGHISSASEIQKTLLASLPTPAVDPLPSDPQGGIQNQQATCAALVQPDPSLQPRSAIEIGLQGEDILLSFDQIKTGTENHPIQVVETPSAIKEEVPDKLNPEVPLDSRAKSATNSFALNEPKPPNPPPTLERKKASIAESVSLRFISDSASQPRVRLFSQCNNVKLLFANAKKGGLLEGEASAAPVLALQVPGISEPITIVLGDGEDFEHFVHLLEDRVASHDNQGGLVVDVRADQID
jgi:hypothetical protein